MPTTESRYPFTDAWVQLNPERCPAPWCGCDLTRARHRIWATPVAPPLVGDLATMFDHDPWEPRLCKGYQLFTCSAPRCIVWARLRAEDLRGRGYGDELESRALWACSLYYRLTPARVVLA
jgi:hypothetical protein